MADRLNDPDRLDAEQRVQEARDALRRDVPRTTERQNLPDVIDEDDLEDMDADRADRKP
jgi:hypothetical protein